MKVRSTLLSLFLIVSLSGASALADGFPVPRLDDAQLLAHNPELRAFLAKPADPRELAGRRVAVLTTDGAEEIELRETLNYFRRRGALAELVAPAMPNVDPRLGVQYPPQRRLNILTVRYAENAGWVRIDRILETANGAEYDAIVIPGGAWNPDSLRIDPNALRFVRQAAAAGRVTAAICHGPVVFINAGILRGRHATSTWNTQIDLHNAGAIVADVPVVVDGKLITSRHPIDIPAFLSSVGAALKR